MNKRHLILRILASPFILGLLIISYSFNCLKHFVYAIRYGGEWITYAKDTRKNIDDIYRMLEKEKNNN